MPDQFSKFDDSTIYEWHDNKNKLNIRKHGIDFDDAIGIFENPILVHRSDRNDEERWVALGMVQGHVIAVIFTRRNGTIRIISARRARRNEKRNYHQKVGGTAAEGQD